MELGAFSASLAVKDLPAAQAFYDQFFPKPGAAPNDPPDR